jgi:hypothetical protein
MINPPKIRKGDEVLCCQADCDVDVVGKLYIKGSAWFIGIASEDMKSRVSGWGATLANSVEIAAECENGSEYTNCYGFDEFFGCKLEEVNESVLNKWNVTRSNVVLEPEDINIILDHFVKRDTIYEY